MSENLRDKIAQLTAERDKAREECGHEKAMRAGLRHELGVWIDAKQKAQAERDVLRAQLAKVERLERDWSKALDDGCPSCGPLGGTFPDCDHLEGYHHALSNLRATLSPEPEQTDWPDGWDVSCARCGREMKPGDVMCCPAPPEGSRAALASVPEPSDSEPAANPRGDDRETASEPAAESAMARWTREMHYHLGAHVNEGPPSTDISDDLRDIRIALLDEEVREYRDAARAGDLVGIADGLADVVYVAYGTAHTYGIPLDAVLAEVHRSNMSKSPNPDGGKFIKGPDYSPPNVAQALGADILRARGLDPYGPECVFDATGCKHFEHRHGEPVRRLVAQVGDERERSKPAPVCPCTLPGSRQTHCPLHGYDERREPAPDADRHDPDCLCTTTDCEVEASEPAPDADREAGERCTCGAPDAYALTPGETIVHCRDGEPCYIAQSADGAS